MGKLLILVRSGRPGRTPLQICYLSRTTPPRSALELPTWVPGWPHTNQNTELHSSQLTWISVSPASLWRLDRGTTWRPEPANNVTGNEDRSVLTLSTKLPDRFASMTIYLEGSGEHEHVSDQSKLSGLYGLRHAKPRMGIKSIVSTSSAIPTELVLQALPRANAL